MLDTIPLADIRHAVHVLRAAVCDHHGADLDTFDTAFATLGPALDQLGGQPRHALAHFLDAIHTGADLPTCQTRLRHLAHTLHLPDEPPTTPDPGQLKLF